MLTEIETHLKETIDTIPHETMTVPINEFDGKIVYGERKMCQNGNLIS